MGLLKKAAHFIGPAIFIFVFIKFVDLDMLFRIFRTVSVKYLLISYIFAICLYLGKIARIYLLLKREGISVGFFSLTQIYSYSNFLGQISNMLVSDISTAGILMLTSDKKLRITNIFVLNKIADSIAVFLFFSCLLYINFHLINNYIQVSYKKIIFVFLVLPAIAAGIFFFLRSKFLLFAKDLWRTTRNYLSTAFLFSIFTYFCYAMGAINEAKALGIDISTSFLLLNYILGSLITILPISVAGIGTRDLSLIALLSLVNVSSEKAIALSSIGFIIIPFLSIALIYTASFIGSRYENSRHR